MRKFVVFDLYKGVGADEEYAPKGWYEVPTLETYLNSLELNGHTVLCVTEGESFWSIITY